MADATVLNTVGLTTRGGSTPLSGLLGFSGGVSLLRPRPPREPATAARPSAARAHKDHAPPSRDVSRYMGRPGWIGPIRNGRVVLIVVVAYAVPLLTTYLPAQQASRVYPAEALWYE